jgi:hypothetical protein
MLPLIVRPALLELTGAAPGSPEFQMWVGRLFYIPAFAGGIFGLVGRLRGVRRGRGVARRALSGAQAPRAGARLHPGVLVARRPARRGRQRPVRHVRREPARHRRARPRPRGTRPGATR